MRIALVLLLVACSKGSSIGSDPEGPLREIDAATMTGDAASLRHALVSPDRLRKAVTCPPTSTLFTDLEGAIEHVGEAAAVFKNAKPNVEMLSLVQIGVTKLAKGDSFRGCTANEPFEVRNFSMRSRLTALGHSGEIIDDTGDVIFLDRQWFALLKNLE